MKKKEINLYEWLIINYDVETMRQFARITREVLEHHQLDSLDEFIKKIWKDKPISRVINAIREKWVGIGDHTSKGVEYQLLITIGGDFYRYCISNNIRNVYWEVLLEPEEFLKMRNYWNTSSDPKKSKPLKENKMKKQDILSKKNRERVNAIAKRYFTSGGKTPADREVLVRILDEAVESYLYLYGGEAFTNNHNIRIAHYIQKLDFREDKKIYHFEMEEMFDFLAILNHDADKHPWIIEEACKAFDAYLKTGSSEDKKVVLFESSKIKISFNAENQRLKLTRYNRRGGNIERPKKYYAQLSIDELLKDNNE
jgi:hypothetical protein